MAKKRGVNGHYVRSLQATKIPARQPTLSLPPTYRTPLGAAYTVDSRKLLAELPEGSVDLQRAKLDRGVRGRCCS
jgi:hypothetical protein